MIKSPNQDLSYEHNGYGMSIIKALQACNIPGRHGNFQCKENHFEISAITLYLFVKIYPSAIPEHSFTISNLIPSLKKIGKGMPKIESETNFQHQSRAITLYLFAKIYPSTIPGHSFPISTLIASLKKIG